MPHSWKKSFVNSQRNSKQELTEMTQILEHAKDKICDETHRLDCPISAIIAPVSVLLVLDLR